MCPRKRPRRGPPVPSRKIQDPASWSKKNQEWPRRWWKAVQTGEGGELAGPARLHRGQQRPQAGGEGGAAQLEAGVEVWMTTKFWPKCKSGDYKVLVLALALGLDATVGRSTPLERPPVRLSILRALTANHVPEKHTAGIKAVSVCVKTRGSWCKNTWNVPVQNSASHQSISVGACWQDTLNWLNKTHSDTAAPAHGAQVGRQTQNLS